MQLRHVRGRVCRRCVWRRRGRDYVPRCGVSGMGWRERGDESEGQGCGVRGVVVVGGKYHPVRRNSKSRVAQRSVRWAHNPKVLGSNPNSATTAV